jgi:predicted component of type VI protein secretion system
VEAFLSLADGRWFRVRNGLLIGRYQTCDIVLDDARVSRRHARVIHENGSTELEDLDSNNGIVRDGTRSERLRLRPGDVLELGDSTLHYLELPDGQLPAGKPGRPEDLRPPVSLAKRPRSQDDEGLAPAPAGRPQPQPARGRPNHAEDEVDPEDDADDEPAPSPARRREPRRRRGANPIVLLLIYAFAFALFTAMAIGVLLVMKQRDPNMDIYRLLEWLRDNFPERFPRPK